MQPFEFQNPTRVVFGPGCLKKLGREVANVGKRAFLVTGQGSVRKNGVYDRARQSLETASVAVSDFEGVEPNPRIEMLRDAAARLAEASSDVVVAVGGGSVMDFAKVLAATPFYDTDPWNMFAHGARQARPPRRALPIVTVPTLAATGSEMNDGAVLTNLATTEKSYVTAPCLYPAVAVVDPELTVSVPPKHTAYGAVDAITHALEGYFSGVDDTPVQDRMAEGVISAIIDAAPLAVTHGADLSARANLQWAAIVALNGWLQAGTAAGFPIHFIEHVISAHTDVAHGAGLAVLGLGWMRVTYTDRPNKYAELARRVFLVNEQEDDSAAQQLAAAYSMFLEQIGAPTHLHQLGVRDDQLDTIADDTIKVYGHKGRIPGRPALDRDGIIDLLHHCI